MALSEREQHALGFLEHRAGMPVESAARALKMKAAALRYTLSRLSERGVIIGRAPFINSYPLGYTDYTLFFSLSSLSPKEKHALLEHLMRSERISWVATLGGEYQVGIAVTAKHASEVRDLFYGLGKQYQRIFYQKTISVRLRFTAFGRKHLARGGAKLVEFTASLPEQGPLQSIDETDRNLLQTLSHGGYRSHRELSRATGIPPTTVERRLKRMEDGGVICGYLYRYNLSALGLSTYRILIHSKGVSPTFREALYHYARSHPLILHYIECSGVWDYELGVEVRGAEALNAIIEELYERFGSDIDGVKTLQIFQHLKYSPYPFTTSK